ncbi:MAG: S1/P1 nuclease [Bdellovibrionia bacterium]
MKSVVVLLLCFASAQAFAWGHRGHEMVGHVAQDELSPRARKILEKLFGKNVILGVEATFPDRVRSNKAYDRFKPWHYADQPALTIADVLGKNFPKPEDQKPAEKEAIPFMERLLADQPYLLANHAPAGDALQALFFLEGILKSPRSSAEQKVFAIRYIAHITGDIHMPLHIGSGLDTGGNSCSVKWKGQATKKYDDASGSAVVPMNLHIVWDDQIPDEKLCGNTSCTSREYYELLRKENALEIKKMKKRWSAGTSMDWGKESGDFREKIYPVVLNSEGKPVEVEGKIPGRPYCKKSSTEVLDDAMVPDLGDAYYKQWRKTAELRILQAGYRLAARLNALLK